MDALVVVLFLVLMGGVAVAFQGPMASLLTDRLGLIESVFIVHFGGAVAMMLPLLAMGGGALGRWRAVPWYTLFTGFLGFFVVWGLSSGIPRLGVGASFMLLVVGQITIGLLIDHFGWLGVEVRALEPTRLLGVLIMLAGVWLVVR